MVRDVAVKSSVMETTVRGLGPVLYWGLVR